VNPANTSSYQRTISEIASLAIQSHQGQLDKAHSLIDKPMMFLAVSDKNALKELNIKSTDEVRLSIEKEGSSTQTINMNSFSNLYEIWEELKKMQLNVSTKVNYI
jgi:hypothetical protein